MYTPREQFNKTVAFGNYAEQMVKQVLGKHIHKDKLTFFPVKENNPEYDIHYLNNDNKKQQTVEVKFDMESMNTGNVFIEFETYMPRTKTYKPSGILATTSDYYVIVSQYLSGNENEFFSFVITEGIS